MQAQAIGRRVVLGVTAIALAALVGAGPARAEGPLTFTFAMPTSPSPYLLPYFIAQDLGWYDKAGLKVEEKVITSDPNSLRALVSGDSDTTAIGPGTTMGAFANGAKIKIVGSWQPVVDYRIVARKGAADSLKDLADKRWAVASAGSMTQTIPKMVMEKQGIETSKLQFFSVGGLTARYQAVAGGTVDASLLDTLLADRGVKEGRMTIIAAVADVFPGLGYVYNPVRDSSLADPTKRKAILIFMRESIKGVRYIVDKPREAAEVMEKRLKEDKVEDMVEALQQMTKLGVWSVNGGLDREVFDFSEKTFRATGELTKDVTYEEVVDPSIVNEVLAEIGKR